ncbi:BT_3987 domain-containing protein [Sphingobacterium bovistauri]|uniref:DUF1735 domain-containing protein n=1 Tax=Sphingobacterium bovistauri TaxID=2781959 RepID=A0ABS7Z9F3_9SPHI|nr:DUF1735 domain-containing protein [Sphingobacterium bovistauri]MCA5005324.1 DUF1735 domain-containing protein [Sphingobacterium bovistauri]
MKKILYIMSLSFLFFSCTQEMTLPSKDASELEIASSDGVTLLNKINPSAETTLIDREGEYDFVFTSNKPAASESYLTLASRTELTNLVTEYNRHLLTTEYAILPETNLEVNAVKIEAGKSTADVKLTIKNFDKLAFGFYLVPFKVNFEGKTAIHMVKVFKDGAYSALSPNSKKAMPTLASNCVLRTEPMKMIGYIETNDWDIRNLANFVLKGSKKPVFDYIVIFAANMNYDPIKKRRYLHFNDKLEPFVKDAVRYTKPLKDRGIKLIVDILPNHQGVGFYNFQSYNEALDFVKELKMWADKLGIDGFDIDEEYANYSVLPSLPTKGNQSVFYFMRAFKDIMPDKLLTLYDYGHSLSSFSEDEDTKKKVNDFIDLNWSDYNITSGPRAGISNHKYGNLSVEGNLRSYYFSSPTVYGPTLRSRAQSNVTNCYGNFMIFNIRGTEIKPNNSGVSTAAQSLSYITQVFYGEDAEFNGKYYVGQNGL